jgi:squalene synthase HpnC
VRLLSKEMRPHVAAIYACAQVAGEIAGQRSAPGADRLAALEAWQRRLHTAIAAERSGSAPAAHEDVMIVALAHSICSLDLPISCFDDLLSAFGQDTMTTRYDSWGDLYEYCRRAANPLGRLVLRVAGHDDETIDRASDAMCTALLLTRCWRDFGDDWLIGRLFVPRDVTAACRAREMDLEGPFLNEAWAAAIRQCLDRTRAQFVAGRAVCELVDGRLQRERRLTWLEGMQRLDRIERAGAALRSLRPELGLVDAARVRWRAVRWRFRGEPVEPDAPRG